MRILWRVLVVLVLIAAILGIGMYAYNIGMAQGLAQKVQAVGNTQMPQLYYGHPFMGFGFGLFGCLVPLFLLFLIFGSLRLVLWHGPMGLDHMHRRHWDWRNEDGKDVPPFFAEWHRRAHAAPEQ